MHIILFLLTSVSHTCFFFLFAPTSFMQTDETVLTFGLKRDASRWGDQAEGYLQYVIQPPWVKLRNTAAWYNLHPNDQTFSPRMFRRSAK